jgi:hypothetical protein
MENFALWAFLIVAAMLTYRRFAELRAENRTTQESVASLRAELSALHEKTLELSDLVDRVTLTPTELEAKHFDRLPALTSDQFAPLTPGETIHLLLKTYTDQGTPIFYEVDYTHRELTYRTPGNKDAAAYGQARLDASDGFRDVRILFSRPHRTAALRGLALDGNVKEGRLLPNNSFKPKPLRGSA